MQDQNGERLREGLEVHHRDHNGGNNNLDNLGAQVEEWPSQEVVGGGIRMPH